MNSLYIQTFKIVDGAIHKERIDVNGVTDWPEVLTYLTRGKLDGMACGAISKLPEAERPEPMRLQQLTTNVMRRAVAQMESVRLLKGVFEEAEKRGIQLINFKGLTLASLYPEPFMRFSCDFDLLVSENQKIAAREMFSELGFEMLKDESKEHVPVYRKGRLVVELHDFLWEDYTGKQVELLNEYRLTAEEKLIKMSAFGLEYTTLGYTEHLVFQVFHVAKHLAFEGISLRYLTDIMLFIDRYSEHIDFSLFWDELKELKYDMLCASLLRICEEYLGMKQRILPSEFAEMPVNEKLVEVIMEKTSSLANGIEQFASVGFVSAYFMRDLTWEGDNTSKKVKLLFPTPKHLKKKYTYAKKCPVLLPIAWGHRIINALIYSIGCKRKGYKSTDILKVADERIKLLDELRMLDN